MLLKYTINGGNPAILLVPSAQYAPRYAMESKIIPACGVADSSIIVAMDKRFNVISDHFVSTF